jgi:aconitate hydratase
MATLDPFGARAELPTPAGPLQYFRLSALTEAGLGPIDRLPFSIRVLLEAALRNLDEHVVQEQDVAALANWNARAVGNAEIPFLPGRVLLQDFTGVPCVVDLAAMRAAMRRLGGDAKRINPLVPCDLVIDHSIQVDEFGTKEAHAHNVAREFERNQERYQFLKWGQRSLANFRVVPPDTGIVHQVNLELFAKVVLTRAGETGRLAFPDSVVGTDSHTTMINGLGVLGWGVGGIEAEAVMLGQPIYMLMPEVIGVEVRGSLAAGATATDAVLTVTQMLRKYGVVGKFVEFFGEGIAQMSLADRATIANMAPEYGATVGFFPVDEETVRYLAQTGRTADEVALVRSYYQAQGLFWESGSRAPEYTDVLLLDLGAVEPSLAGPKRPQDRVPLGALQKDFQSALTRPVKERGFALPEAAVSAKMPVAGTDARIGHGSVVIAAITSCTNTSNPSVMLAAGLLAKKARQRGLRVPPYVKTSLAPGSRVVTDYLDKAGLSDDLAALGFETVGYGCTTCIGNSGPLPDAVVKAIRAGDLVAAAVLSGNRNFEGRINAAVKANYLASPPLVVAFALAGTVDIDLTSAPLGNDTHGKPIYLADIWPTPQEVQRAVQKNVTPEMYRRRYGDALSGPPAWQKIQPPAGDLYSFYEGSTYIQEPPFFLDMKRVPDPPKSIRGARVLVMVGDSVTTDHISPAGSIAEDSPAGRYLMEREVAPHDFNSYGARRGNDRVMTRGTFANIRLRNQLVNVEGGFTRHLPSGEQMTIFDAAQRYRRDDTPLLVLAGAEYGTGSSRDWAAKGTQLLGVRMVLAQSFERIHRSNLVGMGVLPLQYESGQTRETLGLTGEELYTLELPDQLAPQMQLTMVAEHPKTRVQKRFPVLCRIDSPVEVEYYEHGGILPFVLRKLLS